MNEDQQQTAQDQSRQQYIELLEDWVHDFVRLTDIMRDCPQYEALYVFICTRVQVRRGVDDAIADP